MSEDDKLSASATDWRSAALVIGELLADVGPHDYYAMNAEQWLVWALKAIERESLQAENARLTSEVARLREALGNAFCPRPVHGRPAFDTVKGCQQSDNCGCDLGEAFAKP